MNQLQFKTATKTHWYPTIITHGYMANTIVTTNNVSLIFKDRLFSKHRPGNIQLHKQ